MKRVESREREREREGHVVSMWKCVCAFKISHGTLAIFFCFKSLLQTKTKLPKGRENISITLCNQIIIIINNHNHSLR